MKVLLYLLTLGFVLSCSTTKNLRDENNKLFKAIAEAEYSAKRKGELTREEALKKLSKRKFYDNQGILVGYWNYELDGTIYEQTKLLKNKKHKLIKSSTYDSQGNLKRYIITESDEKGNIIVYRTFDSNHKAISIQKNEYDSNENVISMSRTSVTANKSSKTSSKYNSKNQLIEKTEYKPDGSIKDVRTYKYDKTGNEIESDLRRPNGYYTRFISEFDQNNNLTIQNWYDESGKQTHRTSFSHEYDKNNNWITRKRYSNGKLGYVWERIIEYH
ncbi:hypothetical protein [Ulvibacterium marinum]|uniref:RHS repeat protein n=1 Tax=Ulvibacterium marinum TaxID=2419782 RepID=A0A3B0BY92_9FLAO|nr:hypothetical protein [Ulvibacterium marinum]RKN78473.1 hypothetical protein D7Z94_19865 [Ulvibacterium marinum]